MNRVGASRSGRARQVGIREGRRNQGRSDHPARHQGIRRECRGRQAGGEGRGRRQGDGRPARAGAYSLVERAFRCLKTVDLQVRPTYHWLADRVRAHVFLCMLAYHVEWQMRARLKPMLYDDADKEAAEAARDSIVTKAQRSPKAVSKQTTGRTEDGLPVHSFHSLLADLATLTRNTIVTALAPDHPFTLTTRPTTIQQKALDLLGGAITRTQ